MRNCVWKEQKLSETPTSVSQSGKMDSDSRALSLRDATLHRRLVAKLQYSAVDRPDIRYAASIMGDADMVMLKSGEISDQATDHLDALQIESAIRPHHGTH